MPEQRYIAVCRGSNEVVSSRSRVIWDTYDSWMSEVRHVDETFKPTGDSTRTLNLFEDAYLIPVSNEHLIGAITFSETVTEP